MRRRLEALLGKEGVLAIEEAVHAGEAKTSAQIAVFVREWSAFALRRDPTARVRKKAEALFAKHKLDRTAARNAVMIYVSLGERTGLVLGDVGIREQVSEEAWSRVVRTLSAAVRSGQIIGGICAAVAACADILAQSFPADPARLNELPDQPNFGSTS